MRTVSDPHWRNLVPDWGSLIVPLIEGTGEPYLHSRARQYKLTDGRLMTSAEIHASPDNVHQVSAPTLRRRLNDLYIRDPEALWAPVMERGRRCHKP